MLNDAKGFDHIYLAIGYTDLRRGIDGLVTIIRESFHLDPYENSIFLFCGRRCDRIKAIVWEGDGYLVNILHSKKLRQSMSRRGNCWDNAPQESFFGHMKDHIKQKLETCTEYNEVLAIVDDYMDYYNNRRYQWHLAKLSPNEYYNFVTTGKYSLDIPNTPNLPVVQKQPKELGKKPVDNTVIKSTE